MKECLDRCAFSSTCIFATHDDSSQKFPWNRLPPGANENFPWNKLPGHAASGGLCRLYGAGTKQHKFESAYVSVQTQDAVHIPNTIGDGHSYAEKVLSEDRLSIAQCKATFLAAYNAGLVDAPFGRLVVDDAHKDANTTFSLATPLTGKGPMKVKLRYHAPKKALDGLGDAADCNGYLLVHDRDNLGVGFGAYLQEEKAAHDAGNDLWEIGGDGIRSSAKEDVVGKKPQVCLSTNHKTPQQQTEFHTGIAYQSGGDSPCSKSLTTYAQKDEWFITFKGDAWNRPKWANRKFGMGLCTYDGNSRGSVNLVTVEGLDNPCPAGKCGLWSFESDSAGLSSVADALGTCIGFTKPPPPPPTPVPPPSPTPSTCDFCNESHLDCCGDGGIHSVCYDKNYNACCDSPAPSGIDDPVKVVCAKDQHCQPGCSPYVHDAESNTTSSRLESVKQSDEKNRCPGKLPFVSAECSGGTSCCGAHTLTPECYEEEYNECCHPEGSDYSVICAKGQGCVSTPNGVPYCVDAFEACRFCQPKFPKEVNTYLCHPYGSDTCYHAPEPVSCKDVWGPSATFCFGSFLALNESAIDLI